MTLWESIILGIVEGLTEYIPVSSTGHLILTEYFLGIAESASGKTYLIAIQLGAIAAVVMLYWDYFLTKTKGLFKKEPQSLNFFKNLFVAFVPVAIVGLLFGSWIKQVLFSPLWVAAALFIGGVFMIALEFYLKGHDRPKKEIEKLKTADALTVGIFQILSLWPGFSRSMATILGGRFTGLDAKGASEFSFFLAVPTLGAATVYEMLKALRAGGEAYDARWWMLLLVGLVVSFIVAAAVIKVFLAFLKRYPIWYFGVYRIVLAIVLYFILT